MLDDVLTGLVEVGAVELEAADDGAFEGLHPDRLAYI
jgi:hypothetical protein